MEWLNLHASVLDSVEFVGCEPTEQATWLKLLRFSAGQENGGRIANCRDWKDRKWQQLTRCTKREVMANCDLWEWDGEDLVLAFYPIEKEEEVQRMRSLGNRTSEAKREAAKANGKAGGRPRKNPTENPTGSVSENPPETHAKPIEGNKEGNKRERARVRAEFAKRIVEAYPRREKTVEALRIVTHHLDEGEDPEVMLAGTTACAAVIRTLPSGHLNRYVPSAVAFFRDRRWNDDPETLKRQGSRETGQGQMDLEEAKRALGSRAAYLED
jgi:hypothetical protein